MAIIPTVSRARAKKKLREFISHSLIWEMWQNKHDVFFLEKYPTHKKKFKDCLKLNS